MIEVAEEFPTANVYGIDISPVKPYSDAPKNAHFKVEDVTLGLTFENGSTDLLHSRWAPIYNRLVNRI